MDFITKTFKFGQLVDRADICDRNKEITLLRKVVRASGRAVVYGRRRFGKTSVLKNIILMEFCQLKPAPIGIFCDLYQISSIEDFRNKFQISYEEALSVRLSRVQSFTKVIKNYLSNFKIKIDFDPVTAFPSVSLEGEHKNHEKSIHEIFVSINAFSSIVDTLIVFDEFQDIVKVPGLETLLRTEIQNLSKTPVICSGSKSHVLRDLFQDEKRPFYGFGTELEFGTIPRPLWLPYMQERFQTFNIQLDHTSCDYICKLMQDIPNSVQELCQWITFSEFCGKLNPQIIDAQLLLLLSSKSSKMSERLGDFSEKERKVLLAVANGQPVKNISSVAFISNTGISATAIRATIARFIDHGVLDKTSHGVSLTDPIFQFFLKKHGKIIF